MSGRHAFCVMLADDSTSVYGRAGLTDAVEERGVRRVLSAAAFTYVVGRLDRLGYFLALLFIAETMRRYAT